MAVSSAPPHAASGARRDRGRRNIVTAVMVVFLIYFVLPLFWLIISASKTNSELFDSFGLWFAPDFHLFGNLHDVFTFQDGVFVHWLWNTAYYAVCSAMGASLFATMAGYAFAKLQFPMRRVIFAIILGSIMVPATTLAVPLYLLLSKVGLINTPLAVILPSLISPFGVYLMRVYTTQALPDELLDAGRVDGASELRIFWSVALRILAPGFVTVLLFSFVGAWNNYFLPLLVLSKPDFYPLTVGLASWSAQATGNGGEQVLYTIVIAGSMVSIAPLIVAFLFLQRYWESGLTFGSIKS